ncbi:MAG: PadR family transcriptional regulator [Actinobacteria bacterium HGW-Actinobacteria-2]|nr:MAG: PadR family transcriptional regulator [Actinobacteria bacterium HGW-Actinobacteria-2]
MLLLAILSAGESYGYELVTRLHAAGLAGIGAGTVYPVLTRLEREGDISSRLVPSTAGPARKYYALTAHGQQTFTSAADAWRGLANTVEPLLAGAVSSKEL